MNHKNLKTGLIEVKRTIEHWSNTIKETTKSRKIRFVPINATIRESLERAAESNLGKQSLVFGNHQDRVPSLSSLEKNFFYRDIEKAGLRRIHMHDLRHTMASNYIMKNGSLEHLQQILGHQDPKTTKRYVHLSQEFLKGKMDVVQFSPNPISKPDNVFDMEGFKQKKIAAL